jgi:hypothetical protein
MTLDPVTVSVCVQLQINYADISVAITYIIKRHVNEGNYDKEG